MLYSVDRLTRDVGCYFSVLGIYFAHTTERKILRMKFNEKLIEIRKKQGLSQEELGMELQVSRQTISKWETGNSNPDIELLAPIARLLHISLDTLLSFHENLTDVEITELIQEMDKMFSVEGYEKTYQWAVNIIKDYPNCNMLIWQVAVMLDSRRIIGQCEHPDKYDEQINFWYEIALNDKDEKSSTMRQILCSDSTCEKGIMKWQKNI